MSDCEARALTESILALTHELRESRKDGQIRDELKRGLLALEHKLALMEINIMSAISDFAAKTNAFNDRIDTAIAGLQTDVQTLNDLITKLQNSPGQITPEDQASLDAIQARASAVADKLDALDALTPPPAPPV